MKDPFILLDDISGLEKSLFIMIQEYTQTHPCYVHVYTERKSRDSRPVLLGRMFEPPPRVMRFTASTEADADIPWLISLKWASTYSDDWHNCIALSSIKESSTLISFSLFFGMLLQTLYGFLCDDILLHVVCSDFLLRQFRSYFMIIVYIVNMSWISHGFQWVWRKNW